MSDEPTGPGPVATAIREYAEATRELFDAEKRHAEAAADLERMLDGPRARWKKAHADLNAAILGNAT